MIDYQRMLALIASSPLAKPVRVLLAVYEFADFTGAVPAMPIPLVALAGAQVEAILAPFQPVISAEKASTEEKPR